MKQFTSAPQHESRPDENTTDLLLDRFRNDPSVPIFELTQDDGSYLPLSTADFIDEVKQVAKGLIAIGLESGDVVAILSRTRYEWA
ncbi:MAG: long-chain fatty acid--CoA ligase, partial [Brachybacterium tyrofermentans]